MKAQAICGKLFDVEDVCLRCLETTRETYANYVYAVTHFNNSR